MNRRSWRLLSLSDIPSGEDLGSDDPAVHDARTQAEQGGHPTFAGYPMPAGTWHAIGNAFGITAFGAAATRAAAGESLIWPHTEAHYGLVGGKPGTYEPPVWAPDWRPGT